MPINSFINILLEYSSFRHRTYLTPMSSVLHSCLNSYNQSTFIIPHSFDLGVEIEDFSFIISSKLLEWAF